MPSPIRFRPSHVFAAISALLLAGTACAGGASADTGSDLASVQSATGATEGESEPPRPPPPKACQSNQDCSGACPPGSKGCACTATPRGDKVCAPTCSADADCPVPPGAPSGKCDQGVCAPPPPPRPKTCQSADDCRDACPPGSRACTCATTPHGEKVCAPTCGADAGCPTVPGVPPLHCHEGICAPPPPDQQP